MDGSFAPLSRLYAGPFPAIEEKLLSRLPELLAIRGGREHLLLVPSNDLREHLLRRLAARWEGSAAGFAMMTLYDFAHRLLKHRGIFPRELPPARMAAALSAAAREIYRREAGDFAAIAGTPGFVPALARTLADLEEGWIGDDILRAAELSSRAGGREREASRWAEWRRLAAAVERKVRALGGMTRRGIFREAVAGFEQPGYLFRATLYGFYDFTRLQWTLVEALLSSGLLEEVYFPALFAPDGTLSPAFGYAAVTWDRLLRAFEGNAELLDDGPSPEVDMARRQLFATAFPAEERPAPFTVLSAPHEEGEMRLAAREAAAWRRDRPTEEILVLARRFGPEAASAWERMAAEYGIRTTERLAVPLGSVPPVKLLLRMIEAGAEDYPRRKVMEILSSPYRRPAVADAPVPPRPDLWDALTREVVVVSGKDWEVRLSRPGARVRDLEGKEDGERAAQAALLLAEVRALKSALRPVREAKGYGPMARALRALLLSAVRFVDDETGEGERDRRALSALLTLLDDVEAIPEREAPWPGPDEGLSWFAALLSDQRLFVGERGGMRVPGAVIAGDLHALRGVTADRTLLLSVNDDVVPAQVDEDPLLPDEDRELLNRLSRQAGLPDALSLSRRNAAQEKLLFSLPAASARREVAWSVLRADAGGEAKRVSRYLLDLLSRFAGPGVFSESWAEAAGVRVRLLPRSPFAALSSGGPLSRREEALKGWREGRPATEENPEVPWGRIAAALATLMDREEGIGLFPAAPPGLPARGDWSATELDELARCPYRYLLRYRLGLDPVEEPEEAMGLTPAEAGTILHEVLRILGRGAGAGEGWGEVAPAVAAAVARFARENPTGLPGLFRLQCRGIARDAEAFVAWERAREGERRGWRVDGVERAFRLPAEKGLPALRGRIDRIDRGPGGEAEIVDYKYKDGRYERPPLDRIAHGLSNQVPVYLTYARTLSPPPPEVRAAFLFLKNAVRRVAVEMAQWKAVREEWMVSIRGWLALARSGPFPPLPHHLFRFAGAAPPRYCDPCPFKDHCRVSPAFEGTAREQEALRRRSGEDPGLSPVAEHRTAPGAGGATGRTP